MVAKESTPDSVLVGQDTDVGQNMKAAMQAATGNSIGKDIDGLGYAHIRNLKSFCALPRKKRFALGRVKK